MESRYPRFEEENFDKRDSLEDYLSEDWAPEPRGRKKASETGFLGILKRDKLDSLLLHPWLVSILVGVIISVLISIVALILRKPQEVEITPEERAQQEVLGAAKNLEAQESKFLEYVTRNDYSPGVVTNPGLLQAAILEGATRYRNRVIQNQNNPKSPSYNLHEEIINNGSEIEALKRINLGASVKEAELRYIDPATNTWTVVPLDSAELVASGLVKLNIITNSRNGINQKFELVTIAQNTRKALDEIKSLRLTSLRSKGLAPIADELDKIDWFGNKAKPQEAGISNYGKLDEQPTLPPEPKPSTPKGEKN